MSKRMGAARRMDGFTLVELMVTVLIIAVLARVAIPAYRSYVIRGQLVTGTTTLLTIRTQMEQYYQDNRSYSATPTSTTFPQACPSTIGTAAQGTFTFSCQVGLATADGNHYTVIATGSGNTRGAAYQIDQTGVQTTNAIPAVWPNPGVTFPFSGCWLIKRGQSTC